MVVQRLLFFERKCILENNFHLALLLNPDKSFEFSYLTCFWTVRSPGFLADNNLCTTMYNLPS